MRSIQVFACLAIHGETRSQNEAGQDTAENKIYPLRSLRCRGSSRARVCAAKIADGAQAGRLLLRAAASRSDHIDGA